MSEVYPSGAYRDPADMVDSLRRAESHLEAHSADSCAGCRHTLGRVFGHDVCAIGKQRDEDGYCRSMDKKKGE